MPKAKRKRSESNELNRVLSAKKSAFDQEYPDEDDCFCETQEGDDLDALEFNPEVEMGKL